MASCCKQGHKLTHNFVSMSFRTSSSSRLCHVMSSGKWHSVIWLIDSNASKGRAVSIFRKGECPDVGGRRLSTRLDGVTSHETAVSDRFRYIRVCVSVYLQLAPAGVCCVKYLHLSREKRLKCNNPYRKHRWCWLKKLIQLHFTHHQIRHKGFVNDAMIVTNSKVVPRDMYQDAGQ